MWMKKIEKNITYMHYSAYFWNGDFIYMQRLSATLAIGPGSGNHQWNWMYKNDETGNCLHLQDKQGH